MQKNITQWLIDSEGKTSYAYPYFYLDNDKAVWLKEKPNYKWKISIHVGYRDVCLCSSYVPMKLENYELHTSFLKSHLQKAVRLRKTRASVYTADLLLEISQLQLVRRLPIIVIEDAFLHNYFTTLVWYMCLVSQGYSLTDVQKMFILGFVYIIANSEFKEVAPDDCYDEFVFKNNIQKINKLPEDIRNLIYSLETRKVFGGLKGDTEMLTAYENYYMRIPERKDMWRENFYREIRPICLKKTKFLQNEWILSAYDFHCAPNLLKKLEEEFGEKFGDEEEDYKSCIWIYSSSINKRRNVIYEEGKYKILKKDKPQELRFLWDTIKKFVRRKGWGYVNMMLEELKVFYPTLIDYTPPELKHQDESDDKKNENN